ncbi:MAG TPA: helix-turn-helix domain-containing protein [Sphingomicrobium sp.]
MLSHNVDMLRKRLGDTQDQFADRFGVSQGTVSRWGQSMPRGDQLMNLAILAGVLPTDFLTKPLEKAKRGAYVSQPALERAIADAWRGLPQDEGKRAKYLASAVLDAVRLPAGLRDVAGNDEMQIEDGHVAGAPPR